MAGGDARQRAHKGSAAQGGAAPPNTGYMEIVSRPSTGVWGLIDAALTFIVAHYLLWFPAGMLLLSAVSRAVGRAAGPAAGWAAYLIPLAAYARWFFTPHQLKPHGRPWHALRHMRFWRAGHRYTGLTLIRTAVLDPARQYVMGWHPHGILILSRLAMYGHRFEELFPGLDVRALGASPVFYYPGSREISLWLGSVDAGRRTAAGVLAGGMSMIVYPGGSDEIFLTEEHSPVTVLELTRRRGFVQLAIQHGAPLVPVVVFNERKAFTRVDPPGWLRTWCLKVLKLPVLLFYGRGCTLLPRRGLDLGIVFGAPLEVPHLPHVAKDDPIVAETAARYQAALAALWEGHKARFGYGPEQTLSIR